MYSEELREMDRNTVSLMIDEYQEEIDNLNSKMAESLARKDEDLARKDEELLKKEQEIAMLKEQLKNKHSATY